LDKKHSLFIYIIIAYWVLYASITSYYKMWWYVNRLLIIDVILLSVSIILFSVLANTFTKRSKGYILNSAILVNSTWIMYWWNSLNKGSSTLFTYVFISSIISALFSTLILKREKLSIRNLIKDFLTAFIAGVIMVIITYTVLFLSFLY